MSELKQKLAEKIKKAAQERKRQLQLQTEKSKNQPMEVEEPYLNERSPDPISNPPASALPVKKSEPQVRPEDDLIQVYSFREQQMLQDPFIVFTQKQPEEEDEIERQIQQMVSQKQNTIKEDEEEKKRQLIMSALKNKKKQRPPKPMDNPTPFNLLSPPYQQIKIFASYLPIYEERRRRQHYSTIVDLGVKNLPEIVLQCFLEGIITKNFMKSIKDRGVQSEIDFINKFAENRLHQYDFNATKFTPLDHRWLCARLLELPEGRGQKYMLGERVYCVFKQITDFYEVIYGMDEQQYKKLCKAIRIKYKLSWGESAFQDSEILDQQTINNINKIDTSSIFKLRPSPTFGADLEDESKQFFKAKRQKYPDKTKNVPKEPQSETIKSSQIGSKSQLWNSSSDSSLDSFDQQFNSNKIGTQSENRPSSLYKQSSFNSVKKIKKGKAQGKQSIASFSQIINQSSIGSDLSSDLSDLEEDEQEIQQQNMTESMYQSSRSKSISKKEQERPNKSQVKRRKQAEKETEKRIRKIKDQMGSDHDPDIFQD